MNAARRWHPPIAATWALSLCTLAAGVAHGTALADNVRLISAVGGAAQPAPVAQSFSVAQAGIYTVKVTDLGVPNALTALNVAIANSSTLAAQVTLAPPATSASMDVTLAAGDYTVQPLVVPAAGSAGSFNVVVTPQGSSTPLFVGPWAVAASPGVFPPGQSASKSTFTVTDGGSYQLSLIDRAFPAALAAVQLIVLHQPDGAVVPCTISLAVPSCAIVLTAGDNYDLVVLANADATELKGLYSLDVYGGSTGTSEPYSATVPVGNLAQGIGVSVPASESVTAQLTDLSYPTALTSLRAVVTQGAQLLQQFNAPATATINAAAGPMQVFTLASADATKGEGAYGVYVHDAANTLADVAVPVVDSSHVGYAFSTFVGATGNDQLVVTDYGLPSPLVALDALVEQQGQRLGVGVAPAPAFSAALGKLNVLVFAAAPVAGANGLFGIDLVDTDSSSTLFQATQGVGASFQTVDVVASAGRYLAQLTDLGFPANFSQVWLIGTGNRQVLTQIVIGQGSSTGRVVFDVPTSGNYVINVLAQTGAGQQYGLYGFNLIAAPPAPVVTLAASAPSVVTGSHVTLTWSSTDATSCTASDGWTGTLASSGNQDSTTLTANTTFTLTCDGDGGSTSAQVQVQVTKPPDSGSSGGGGALDTSTVWLLALAAAAALRRRFARASRVR